MKSNFLIAAILAAGLLNLSAAEGASPNTLTASEKKAGWKLLFDGKSLDGWHNF